MAIPVNSTTDSELETLQLRAQTFYLRAWGKPWPRETKTLDRVAVLDTDRAPTDDTDVMDVDELKDDTDIVDDAPDSSPYEYVCLTDVKMLQDTFRPTTMVPNVIVCLQMYSTFIDSMKSPAHQHRKGFVVTGQPGIGAYLGTSFMHVLTSCSQARLHFSSTFSCNASTSSNRRRSNSIPIAISSSITRVPWFVNSVSRTIDLQAVGH